MTQKIDSNDQIAPSSTPQLTDTPENVDPDMLNPDQDDEEEQDDFAPDFAFLVDQKTSLHTIQTSGPAAGLEFTHKSRDFSNLFVARGERDVIPESLEGKSAALERSLLAQRQVLSEERVLNKSISMATWFPDLNLAHCHVIKGNHLRSIGKSVDGRLWLFPEECLFLMECGSLICNVATVSSTEALETGDAKEVPMSIQQAMQSMLDFHAPLNRLEGEIVDRRRPNMDDYAVYSYLKRLGFLVLRHNAEVLLPPSKKPVKVISVQPKENVKPVKQVKPRESKDSKQVVKQSSWMTTFVNWFTTFFKSVRKFLSPLEWLWSRWFPVPEPKKKSPPKPKLVIPPAPVKVQHQSLKEDLGPRKSWFYAMYDVYRSSTHTTFKKSNPGPPDYHVAIVNVYSPPPSAADWQEILQGLDGDIMVKLAVVETASISFFDVTEREIVSKGTLNPRHVKKNKKKGK